MPPSLRHSAYVIALGTDEEGTGVLFAGDEAYVAGASEVIVGGTVVWADDSVGRFGLSNGVTVDYAALLADDSSALASVSTISGSLGVSGTGGRVPTNAVARLPGRICSSLNRPMPVSTAQSRFAASIETRDTSRTIGSISGLSR